MAPPAAPPPRVLVVDDDELGRRTLARVLRSGFEVIVTDAEGALERLVDGDIDVVVIGSAATDELRVARWRRHVEAIAVLHAGRAPVSALVVDAADVDQLRRDVQRAAEHARRRRAQKDAARVGLDGVFRRALDSMWSTYDPVVRAADDSIYGYEARAQSTEPSFHDFEAVLDAAERLGKLGPLMERVLALAEVDLSTAPPATMVLVRAPFALVDAPPRAPTGLASRVIVSLQLGRSSPVHDPRNGIRALRNAGYRVAVGDMGAGYAGLTRFLELEADIVRLEGALVRDIDASAATRSLVASIARLCHEMGVLLLAGGVENAHERDALVEAGCDLLQGRHVARDHER